MNRNKHLEIMKKIDDIGSFLGLYFIKQRDYNTGEKFTQTEVHILEMIVEHPNISSTEIAKKLYKTKSSISQITKKLIEKGLLLKNKNANDLRSMDFLITEKGYFVHYSHKNYDNKMCEILKSKTEHFSEEDIDKILDFLNIFSSYQIEFSPLD